MNSSSKLLKNRRSKESEDLPLVFEVESEEKKLNFHKEDFHEKQNIQNYDKNEDNAKKRQLEYARNQGFIGSISTIWLLFLIYFNSNGFERIEHKYKRKNLGNILISKFSLPKYKMGVIVILLLISSIISYWFSVLIGSFWSALESKEQGKFQKILLWYLLMLILNSIINFIKTDLSMRVQIDLRMWLTDLILNQYYSELTYYQFAIKKIIDNPDQRISEDIALFSSHLLLLICRLVDNIFDFIVYSILLYKINTKLFITALIYSGLGTFITAKFGLDVILLKVEEKKLESDFRYSIVRVRENAENVALYGGSQYELSKHKNILKLLLQNLMKKRALESKMGFFGSIFKYLIRVLPIAVISKDYFANNVPLGKINQCSLAFNSIVEDVAILVNTFKEISNLFSSVDRIGHFIKLLVDHFVDSKSVEIGEGIIANIEKGRFNDKLNCLNLEEELLRQLENCYHEFKLKLPKNAFINSFRKKQRFFIETNGDGAYMPRLPGRIRSVVWSEPGIKVRGLCINIPDSNGKIFNNISFEVEFGDKILISGDSGVGKSSLLKAISGIWHDGSGTIFRPPSHQLLFIPQRPYCTYGSLREQLFYPLEKTMFVNDCVEEELDSYLIKILDDVGLSYIFNRFIDSGTNNFLDVTKDWSTTLSLGEQQRLAFARIIISNPYICFLDEATSALDVQTEAKLYSILFNRKSLTYVSIGHRPSIEKFHNRRLVIQDKSIKLENIDVLRGVINSIYYAKQGGLIRDEKRKGDRLVAVDINCNFYIFDLLPVRTHLEGFYELTWVKTSTLFDDNVHGVISKVSWAPECFGQMFAAGSSNKSISIWCETRQGYQDTYHLFRNGNIYLNKDKSISEENLPMSIKDGSSWKLAATFSPFKGKVLDIIFAPKDSGLLLAACDSKGFVGFFNCNNPKVRSGWVIELIKVRKSEDQQENSTIHVSNEEGNHFCSLDWIPNSSKIGLSVVVAIDHQICILNKSSKSWDCIETLSTKNLGLIKDIACCPFSLLTEYYKLVTVHFDNKLIIWRIENELNKISEVKNRSKIISRICKLEISVPIVSF